MFVSNDPYVGTPHQPDTIVAAPVFVGDELFCWVANVMHHADVGGSVMGSLCVDAADIFTDPPAFPPFKLVSRGEVRRDLEQMFLRQSRVPTEVHMDLRAAISANRVAVARIAALADRPAGMPGSGIVTLPPDGMPHWSLSSPAPFWPSAGPVEVGAWGSPGSLLNSSAVPAVSSWTPRLRPRRATRAATAMMMAIP